MRKLDVQAKAHHFHILWHFISKLNAPWGQVLSQKYLKGQHLVWSVGDGSMIHIFLDKWIPGLGMLSEYLISISAADEPPNRVADLTLFTDSVRNGIFL